MKITAIQTQPVSVPLRDPVKTAIHDIKTVGCLLVELQTDTGLVGQSYVFSINAVRLRSFDDTVQSLAPLVLGRNPHFVTAIGEDIWANINPSGYAGATISALSALDTACWDIIGKAAGQPLHHIFGACRDRVRTYASGGLWLSLTVDQLVAQAQTYLTQGFRAMKARIGKPSAADDVARIKAIREAIGPDITLMVDANQSLAPKQAIRLGQLLEEYDISWFEEPVNVHDQQGQADIRRALTIPVASGETEWTRFGLRPCIEKRLADIVMPDLQRVGGLTEMRRVAALAEAYCLPISTHVFTEHSLSIAGSVASCISVEHMPWFAPLFVEEMRIEDGDVLIPNRPGTGFTFDAAAIETFALASPTVTK